MVNLVEQNRKLEISRTDELQNLKNEINEVISLIPPIQALKTSVKLSDEIIDKTPETLEQISTTLLQKLSL